MSIPDEPSRGEESAVSDEAPSAKLETAFAHDPPLPRASEEPASGARAPSPWVAVAGVVLLTGAGAVLAFDLDRAGERSFWAFAVGPTAVVALFALARAARDGDLSSLRPAWGDATWGLASAGALLAAATLCVPVLAPIGSPRESWLARLYLQIGDPRWLHAHTGLVALLVLAAAAAEEIVWRGLVTELIAERVGSRTAWAWASIPYALSLVPTAWALRDPEAGMNPLLVVGALGLGLAWGAIARFTRRLVPGVLSHAAFDLGVIVFFRLWGHAG